MNPEWGLLAGVITLILFATFVGIWIWAWRKRHRATFDALSRLPMQDAANGRDKVENDHGNAEEGKRR
ncbi:MAG TPA: cbb3-type cytochrome c oxidase subunit 3 [Casimicrobiaceae bacterium]|nr:cbb3-type cytochrome c oxidase subunit 3 [Casimicrobiaceae bacterium]